MTKETKWTNSPQEDALLNIIEKYVAEPCQMEVVIALAAFVEEEKRKAFEAGGERHWVKFTGKGLMAKGRKLKKQSLKH